MQKRYYWLKLQEDFFESKRIKKLRKIAGGDTCTIIYLKMQLLSVKKGGVLEYSGLEDSFAEEIALDIDEDTDDVAITINYLLKTGLLETSDNKEYLLPFAVNNIGSEGESAERMRKFREDASHCANIVPKSANNVLSISISKSISIYYADNELLNSAFADYVEFRKKIKKPMTDRAIKLAMNNVERLSKGDSNKAIEILNQSVMNGWSGLYELKEQSTMQKPKSKFNNFAQRDNNLDADILAQVKKDILGE